MIFIDATGSCILFYSQAMPLKTITFRLPEEKLQALDSFAEVQQRDRSFTLNEAVNQYLSLNDYHVALIQQGTQQDDAGEILDHKAVNGGRPLLDSFRCDVRLTQGRKAAFQSEHHRT